MGETWQVDDHKVIEVGSEQDPVRRLRVGLVGGRVDVVAHDDPEGRLEVHSVDGRPLEVSWEGGTLAISHPQARWDKLLTGLADTLKGEPWSFKDTAQLSVAVPRGVTVQIGTVSAEGVVASITDHVELRTVSGAFTLDGVTGSVVARTVSGTVEARGQVGDMRMDSVSGSFTVQSDGAPTLAAKTVSGSLSVDAVAAPLSIAFSSVSGGLVLRQADRTGYDVDLRSVSGHVVVGGQQVTGYGSVKHQRHDPGATMRVKASTVSGDITLLSASAPTASA
jgi:DUF4097 and DUF4098 domain-containing protein YvlB